MKNKIRHSSNKNRFEWIGVDSKLEQYNFSFISILSEILIGSVVGIAICLGLIFSFFIVRGSLFLSVFYFVIILVITAFFVLLLKYVFLSVCLKKNEVELLKKFLNKKRY